MTYHTFIIIFQNQNKNWTTSTFWHPISKLKTVVCLQWDCYAGPLASVGHPGLDGRTWQGARGGGGDKSLLLSELIVGFIYFINFLRFNPPPPSLSQYQYLTSSSPLVPYESFLFYSLTTPQSLMVCAFRHGVPSRDIQRWYVILKDPDCCFQYARGGGGLLSFISFSSFYFLFSSCLFSTFISHFQKPKHKQGLRDNFYPLIYIFGHLFPNRHHWWLYSYIVPFTKD